MHIDNAISELKTTADWQKASLIQQQEAHNREGELAVLALEGHYQSTGEIPTNEQLTALGARYPEQIPQIRSMMKYIGALRKEQTGEADRQMLANRSASIWHDTSKQIQSVSIEELQKVAASAKVKWKRMQWDGTITAETADALIKEVDTRLKLHEQGIDQDVSRYFKTLDNMSAHMSDFDDKDDPEEQRMKMLFIHSFTESIQKKRAANEDWKTWADSEFKLFAGKYKKSQTYKNMQIKDEAVKTTTNADPDKDADLGVKWYHLTPPGLGYKGFFEAFDAFNEMMDKLNGKKPAKKKTDKSDYYNQYEEDYR